MDLPCIMEEAENSPYIRPSVAAYTGVLIFQACCAMFSSVGRNMCICNHLYLNACMAVICRPVPKGRILSRCKCTAIGCIACGPAQKNCCQWPTDRQTNPPGLKAGKQGYSESARAICERVYERKQVSLYLSPWNSLLTGHTVDAWLENHFTITSVPYCMKPHSGHGKTI